MKQRKTTEGNQEKQPATTGPLHRVVRCRDGYCATCGQSLEPKHIFAECPHCHKHLWGSKQMIAGHIETCVLCREMLKNILARQSWPTSFDQYRPSIRMDIYSPPMWAR